MQVDPEISGLKIPGKQAMTYEKYLQVSQLLDLQRVLSSPAEHDETLFIIIHQVYELWFKQVLHEVELCNRMLQEDNLMPVMQGLKRIDAIQKVFLSQMDVLETMPPDSFNRFRNHLNPASGFQSYQFRITEFLLGQKNPDYLKFYQHTPELKKMLEDALAKPSLYDHFLGYLSRRGLPIPQDVVQRDVRQPHTSHPGVVAAMKVVYERPYEHYDIYLALESLMDLDEQFLLWRFRHKTMVERMIGSHRGTGGSSGARYLGSTLAKRFFPEIWEVRNELGGLTPYGN